MRRLLELSPRLSFVSSEDLDEPLTPSHLLTGRRLLCLPDPPPDVDPDYGGTSVELSLRARYLNTLLDHYTANF